MQRRAKTQDEGALLILVLVIVASVAIAAKLAVVKNMHGTIKFAHIALAGTTVLSSWAFI